MLRVTDCCVCCALFPGRANLPSETPQSAALRPIAHVSCLHAWRSRGLKGLVSAFLSLAWGRYYLIPSCLLTFKYFDMPRYPAHVHPEIF